MGHKSKKDKWGKVRVYGAAASENKCGKEWGANQKAEETVTCSLIKAPIIYLDITPRQKIILLMDEYDSREWIGYLVGEIDKTGDYYVSDLVIPPHKESLYSSAEAEAFHTPENCIGVIHSHHKMGAFHSGTDQTHVDRNYPISITVAKGTDNLTFDAKSCTKTPCGKPVALTGEVKYLQPVPNFDRNEWLKVAKEEIDKGQFKAKVYNCGEGIRNYLGGYSPLDRQAIIAAAIEDEGLAGIPTVKPIVPWYKKSEEKKDSEPMKPIITTKMIDKLAAKLFDEKQVILTRAQLEEILEKNPAELFDGVEAPSGWSI